MSKPSPAFQFYPADWLSSQRVQMMTLEEEGAYIRLLLSCWQHGSIPSSPELCARIIGKGASTTLATVVQAMFQPDLNDGSKMVHDRLEKERQKQAEWRLKSSEGGKKSAAKRANLSSKSKGGSRVVQPPYQPNGNSSSSSSSTDSTTAKAVVGRIASRSPQLADDEWLKSLADDPAYAGINVTTEFGKMQRWCEANRKMPSRKRFVNWLNRAEKPMAGAGTRPAPKHAAYDAATATAGRTADEILNF